jgi:hypothetical protein
VTAEEVPDPQRLPIRCRLNGELMQDSITAQMIWGVADLVSILSQTITLEPSQAGWALTTYLPPPRLLSAVASAWTVAG